MQGIAFGPTIRLLRQAKGISLRELARQLGVSPAFLSQIEAGRQHKIPRARIVQVADMLGVSEGYLLGTAKQVHPDLIKFLSETPEAAEFMVSAMRGGLSAEDFTQLREAVSDRRRRATLLRAGSVAARRRNGSANGLDGYLDSTLCLAGVGVQSKGRLFQRFAKLLTKKRKGVSADLVVERLERREHLSPTSVGGGVAIPHAFVPDIDTPVVGAFTLKRSISYGTLDAERVKTVFFLVGREGRPEDHLPILARIARLCSTPEFLHVFGTAKTSREIYKTILAWDKRISS